MSAIAIPPLLTTLIGHLAAGAHPHDLHRAGAATTRGVTDAIPG
jgi:hypothetical protein